jgi:cytochrome c
MNGFELNKIAASILLAGIIALVVGFVTDALYHPDLSPEKRGYTVAGAEEAGAGGETAAAPAGPVDIAAYMSAGDAAKGAVVAKKCAICHDFTKGGPNKIGPNLWGTLGGQKAHASGFAYSDALKAAGGNWGYQELSEFLTSPAKYVKGTKMVFAGLGKPEERAHVIAYLRSLSDSPMALPAAPAPMASAEEAPAAPAEEKK